MRSTSRSDATSIVAKSTTPVGWSTWRAHSGFRFTKSGNEWRYAEYVDGNRDGLRTEDIAKGIDRPLFPPRPVLMLDCGAGKRPAFGSVVSRLGDNPSPLPAYVSLDRPTTDEFE